MYNEFKIWLAIELNSMTKQLWILLPQKFGIQTDNWY